MRLMTYAAIFILGGLSLATVVTSDTLLVRSPFWGNL